MVSGVCVPAARAQSQSSAQEYERRIQTLEDRLRTVEAQLAVLMSERAPVAVEPARTEAPIATAPASSPATSAAIPEHRGFEMPPELVPEIGKIGAEVGVLASDAASPFKLNPGQFYGGYIDLPLVDRPAWLHGKISYEIVVGLSRSRTALTTTSNVAQVANLAVLNAVNPAGGLANVNAALTGTGGAPFPVSSLNQVNLRLLQVIPFAFKYSTTALDRLRLRPYAVLGFGTYVTIHDEVPMGGKGPFSTALVAGQIGQSPELVARGLPGGNGNLDIGLQTGGGLELRLTRTLSLGFDARFNKISGSNGDFGTYGTRVGFHF